MDKARVPGRGNVDGEVTAGGRRSVLMARIMVRKFSQERLPLSEDHALKSDGDQTGDGS